METQELQITERRLGRSFYRAVTRQSNPIPLDNAPLLDSLAALLGSSTAARSILRVTDGNLRNLAKFEVNELIGLDGIHEAMAGRIAALFAVHHHLLRKPA